MQASRERMSGWQATGMSSPWRAWYSANAASIIGVSSQWVMIGVGASRNTASRITGSSTSMFPVEAPMNTFRPGVARGSIARIASRLSLLVPM